MIEILIVSFGITFLASISQVVSGFGFAIIAVPLLAIALDPLIAVATVTALSAVLSTGMALQDWKQIDLKAARTMSLAGLVGMPFGLAALSIASDRTLTLVIASVVSVLVCMLWFEMRLPNGPAATKSAGVVSGLLLTSTGMNGPPLVLAFHNLGFGPLQFRSTLQAVFSVQDLLAVAAFVCLGYIRSESLVAMAGGILAIPLGFLVGNQIFYRVSPARFRQVVLVGLLLTAASSIIKSFP